MNLDCPDRMMISADAKASAAGRIVLADDTPFFCESTARLLEAAGFVCHRADCAAQARVVGYLIKPIDAGHLIATVRREVRAHRIRRFIRKRRAGTELLLEQLRQLEQVAAVARTDGLERELQAYLAMFAESVVVGLRDWTDFVAAASAPRFGDTEWQRLVGARPFQLMEGLREAVQVLERTKFSFKSRELAELRKRLETLLTAPSATALAVGTGEAAPVAYSA